MSKIVTLMTIALTTIAFGPAPPAMAQSCPSKTMMFAAHPDDDIIFANPADFNSIWSGGCLRVVYVTAG